MKTIEEVHARMLAICEKAGVIDDNSTNFENFVRIYKQNKESIAFYVYETNVFYNYGALFVQTVSLDKVNYNFNYNYFFEYVEKSVNGEKLEFDEDKLLTDSNVKFLEKEIFVEVEKDNPKQEEEIKFLRGLLNSQKLIIKK